jgi:hypothetical protein
LTSLSSSSGSIVGGRKVGFGFGQQIEDLIRREHLELRWDGALVLEEAGGTSFFEWQRQNIVATGG